MGLSLPATSPAPAAAGPAQAPATPLQPVQPLQPVVPPEGEVITDASQLGLDEDASEKKKDEESIYLNFDNASLSSILNYLAEQKKINMIPNKELENVKVSLSIRNPLTLERAWNVLLTLFEMNNFSLIKVGNVFRIITSADNGFHPLPTYSSGTGTEPEDLPDSDLVVRYVYFFRNIKAEVAKGILGKMVDDRGVIENRDLNALIIKDRCFNIKAALRIVKELDIGGLREAIEVIPLQWVSADHVDRLFKSILSEGGGDDKKIKFVLPGQKKESAYFSKDTKIIPDQMQNRLILLGTQTNINKIKKFIAKHIDRPIDDAQSRLHIKELQYLKAADMKGLIERIVEPPATAGEKAVVVEGGYKVFEDVIVKDETGDRNGDYGSGNRIIVACNRDDWRRLESFIDKLDKPQPQVAIEIMIVDVALEKERQLGAQLYNIRGKSPGMGIFSVDFQNLNANKFFADSQGDNRELIKLATRDFEGKDSPAFISLGKAATQADPDNNNIWGMVKALLNTVNANVISQPYLVANNNEDVLLRLTDSRRVDGSLSERGIQVIQKKTDMNAIIEVQLKPHINLEGNVDFNIDISIDEFQPSDVGGQPVTNNRKMKTKTSMLAGQVLVLGGLTRSRLSESLHKTPILGDIPILGTLFKNREKQKTETNLYIFIRPSIIKPRFEGAPDEYTQFKLDYAKYQVMKNDGYIRDSDPIQRWFFRPSKLSIKQKLDDNRRGVLRAVDNFTFGKDRPREVDIKHDPTYRGSEALERAARIRRQQQLFAEQEMMQGEK